MLYFIRWNLTNFLIKRYSGQANKIWTPCRKFFGYFLRKQVIQQQWLFHTKVFENVLHTLFFLSVTGPWQFYTNNRINRILLILVFSSTLPSTKNWYFLKTLYELQYTNWNLHSNLKIYNNEYRICMQCLIKILKILLW